MTNNDLIITATSNTNALLAKKALVNIYPDATALQRACGISKQEAQSMINCAINTITVHTDDKECVNLEYTHRGYSTIHCHQQGEELYSPVASFSHQDLLTCLLHYPCNTPHWLRLLT